MQLPTSALAAIDLGSNSFRLEVGQVHEGQYQRHHCFKEMVSLGAGLDMRGMLSGEAIDRGLRCLRQFSAELAALRPERVRVVATQTLREARNRDDFLYRAEVALGQPVEVISGEEEAWLIYTGVSFLHPAPHRRLVIDIGGRSTEMIVGQAGEAHIAESFRVGSASVSQQFFADGRMSAEGFRSAQRAVDAIFSRGLDRFANSHWDEAMGTSGTAGMLSDILLAGGITDGTLTPAGLRWLIERCIEAEHVENLRLPGMKSKRRRLLPGGLSILYTLLVHCDIGQMVPAMGALRQGVIVDLHQRRQLERVGVKLGQGRQQDAWPSKSLRTCPGPSPVKPGLAPAVRARRHGELAKPDRRSSRPQWRRRKRKLSIKG